MPTDISVEEQNSLQVFENELNGTQVGKFIVHDSDDQNLIYSFAEGYTSFFIEDMDNDGKLDLVSKDILGNILWNEFSSGTFQNDQKVALNDNNYTNDNELFYLDANGTLLTAQTFDYETSKFHPIAVRVTHEDGNYFDKIFSVSVLDRLNVELTVLSSDGGFVFGGGIFDSGEIANISAVSNEGFAFKDWSGDFTSTDNPISFSMENDMSLSATFIHTASFVAGVTDGNASGIAYVQVNPSTYSLYTEAEKNAYEKAAKAAGQAEGAATMHAEIASKGLALVTYMEQMEKSLPYTQEWFYQPGMGWLWTQANILPFIYQAPSGEEAGGWLYFSQLADQPSPSFYDYATETWITPSASD